MISNLKNEYIVQCYDVWIEENYHLINENNIIGNEALSSGPNFLTEKTIFYYTFKWNSVSKY
jgi:hypothetical protein